MTENPYFEEVVGGVVVGTSRWEHSPKHFEMMRRRRDLVNEYSWAVPNEEAVETVAELSPILEVGAGGGYWARLLSRAGADVLATDVEPVEGSQKRWFPVWEADARSVVTDYPDRSLLVVWPTDGGEWATAALGAYLSAGGGEVAYVGEGRVGVTATDRFHEMLYDRMELERTVDIPHYVGVRDRLEVWRAAP